MKVLTRPVGEALLAPGVRVSRPRRYLNGPELVIAAPAILLFITCVLRWVNGRASIDVVVYDQGLWALSRGFKPFSSVIQETLLEDHFGPGILGFGLLYRLVATPIWLFLAQAGAAWWSVRLIARRMAPSVGDLRAAIVGGALLLSPPVAYALLFDFHSVTLAVPFALVAMFALEDGQPRRALLFGFMAALFRVEIGMAVVVAFAVWPGPRRNRLWTGLTLAGYLLVALHFEKALGHDSYWPIHFGYLGSSPSAALMHPMRLVRAFLSPDNAFKTVPWLGTGAFMALRRPRLLLPTAVLALPVILSQWPGTSGFRFHYGYAPTLLLALAWLPLVLERPDRSKHVVAGCLLLSILIGPVVPGLLMNPVLSSFGGQYWAPDGEARCILTGIPGAASLSSAQPISLATHRRALYLWPYPFEGALPGVLPGEHLSHGNPRLAAGVDYLVIRKKDADHVPEGFVPDGESRLYLRFRRGASTVPSNRTCS
jgi:uncharacterized membrane protein